MGMSPDLARMSAAMLFRSLMSETFWTWSATSKMPEPQVPSFAPLGAPNAGQTTFSYATSTGAVVTGSIGYQNAPAFGTYTGCGFFGTVTSS